MLKIVREVDKGGERNATAEIGRWRRCGGVKRGKQWKAVEE